MKRKAAGCKRLSHLNDCNDISVCKEMENIHPLIFILIVVVGKRNLQEVN